MVTQKRHTDRRVQRTDQLLRQAFVEVIQEKGFAATSIQDITERANFNRGTFYLHFADKYILLDLVIRERFQQSLASQLPPAPRWDRPTLHRLIQAVLVCLEGKYHHQPHPSHFLAEIAPQLERTMQEELTGLLLAWLKQEDLTETWELAPLETTAGIVSWSIFGPAIEWSQAKTTVSCEQMAQAILRVIMAGVALPA